ncbi:hypothetical protein SDRG_00477 [Saprolegnia diclina VS20]|uniref:RGS domain-containing protein n=1 Tax=Saprolegnia diclina (strain VS20) TaxID=1156394 RepID=T0QWY8_SAPDV|nr:hypothetical protein SDRG_00477 [Saprolegnia diclina VS20]EQC42754.1 hypothetical protein SDRG_00477 [Saprolegnia diclina VS20]|eukprot:XP_008604177.1 hypothetical protein SDRG_00477 [Saprolegnia diclina VS20]
MALDPADVPMLLTWATYAYMPVALHLFVSRRQLSSIKYREPLPMSLAALFLSLYSLCVPPLVCFGGHSPYTLILFFEWILLITGLVTYLLTQCILVVKFHITEVLMDPVQATVVRVGRIKYLRWLLYPRFQLVVWATATALLNAPLVLFANTAASVNTTVADFNQSDGLGSIGRLRLYAGIETGVLILASYALARSMSRIVDNFGLKEAYARAARVMTIGVILYMSVTLLAAHGVVPGFDACHVPTLIGLHTAHAVFAITVVRPLRASYAHKETHKDLKARLRQTKRDVDQLESMVLYRYLNTDGGFGDFLAFSKKELCADAILAWREVQRYKEGGVAIEHIYATCLDAGCQFQVNIAPTVRRMYEIQRPMVCSSLEAKQHKLSISLKRFHRVLPDAALKLAAPTNLSSVAPILDHRTSLQSHGHGHRLPSQGATTIADDYSRMSVSRSKHEKLFHPLGAEFLRVIYMDVLPRFEEHAATDAWVTFRNREKAMLSLDTLEHMIDGTIEHGAEIAQRGSMPCIADLPRIQKMLARPTEEFS